MVGSKSEKRCIVDKSNVASAVASGTIDVFSTPMMIALMESAAADCVGAHLEEGMTSVGTRISVEHVSATPIGMEVRAEAEIVGVDGKKIEMVVSAYDEAGIIGKGEHTRYIVNAEKFMSKTSAKLAK